MRLLFLVRRVGPYHNVRFEAAGRRLDLTVVETRPDSVEYPWTTSASARQYQLVQLLRASNPEAGLHGAELERELRRKLDNTMPDAVACTGWADQEYHAALRLCHRRGIPVVLMSDSTLVDEPRRWWKEQVKRRLVSGYSAAVVAGTRSRTYLEGLGFARDAIFSPWDVVDNDYFARMASAAADRPPAGIPDRPYFLCISRFVPKKNLFRLVEAFAAYRQRADGAAWDLVILGSGELEARLRTAIAAAEVTGCVHLPGFVQYDRLPAFYSRAGACILPSLSDQWGLAINEAMACGLPVIVSTACGCAPDLVREGVNGWLFPPEDTARLTELLRRAARLSTAERRSLGNAGRDLIAHYSADRFAEALASAAQSACARPVRAALPTTFVLTAMSWRT